jgi:hypothetical protein
MKSILATFLLIIIFLLIIAASLKAQKPQLIELKEEVAKQASMELDQALSPSEGSLFKFAQKNNLSGEYTMLLTLRNKGQVVSVFVQDKKDWNIPSQNSLKDKLLEFQFSFKMPKNKDYKLSYTFKF